MAETRRRAVAEAALKLRRAQAGEAKRLAAAQRKADRAWENQMRTLLIVAKMLRAGGPAMRAEFEATLAQVYELFDARLAAAERAAAGADATDAERHIVRALRQLRETPPPQKREEGARKQWSNWTSPYDNLSEEEQRKDLERRVRGLATGSPPSIPASSPGRAETSPPSSPGRATQVGFSRLAHCDEPISDKSEIGAARPGDPRLAVRQDVDGRVKPGHDE